MPTGAEPFSAAAVMAFVLGLFGAIFAALWWRDRERGMGWFAAGMALMCLLAAAAPQHHPWGSFLQVSVWSWVLVAGLACLALGLIDYLHVPPAARRKVTVAMLLAPAAYALLVAFIGLTGALVPRSQGQLPVALAFGAMGALAAWGSRREPGAGHAVVAGALLAVPVLAVVTALRGANAESLRSVAFGPFLVLALTLLTASLLRRRRALEAEVARRSAAEAELTRLNSSLEQVVAERTAELHDLVAGLESFNRSVSHDLRGSLGGIGGLARMADQALQRGDETLARRALPAIAEQADNSARLMAALLSLARVGDATLQRQPVELRQLVQQVIDQLRLEQGDRPMPQIEVAPEMPRVHADPELLKPVFANLIGNAIKFTRDARAGRIEIGASGSRDGITVHVRDNGVGFDADAAQRLFAPFVRLHEGQFDGHGVGLSIVRRAVERHGGRVWAESQPGQGAVFRFSLPAVGGPWGPAAARS